MSQAHVPRFEVDGQTATAEQLSHFALNSYGHFTAMQIRDRATRGLGFHLARLDAATQELFGTGLAGDRVRELVRHALGDDVRDASVRVNVFQPDDAPDVSLLVSVRPPARMPDAPQRLRTAPYQRPVAHIKHVGGFGQAYHRRLALADGYDEALLTSADGVIAEGTVSNIAFLEGERVVWPDAPALDGIGMLVLRRELTAAGVPWLRRTVRVADVGSYDGAVVVNSRGITPVGSIDGVVLPTGPRPAATVLRLAANAPWDAL